MSALQGIRNNLKFLSVILWLLVAAFIGTIFLVWGRGTYKGNRDVIATVGKEPITYQEFRETYGKMMEFYRRLYGKRFNDQLIKRLKLKEKVLDGLINEKIALEVARESGIGATDADAARVIASIPAFQVNGKFDPNRYKQALAYIHSTPEEFDIETKNNLTRNRVYSLIKDSVDVTPAEVRNLYLWENEKVKVKYAVVEANQFLDRFKPTDKELANYYSQHKEQYRLPERVRFSYAALSLDDFDNKVKVTEEEKQRYYKENSYEFPSPAGVWLKTITVKDNATVQRIYKELLKKPKRFEELAKKYSKDPFAKEGGVTGFVAWRRLDPTIKRAIKGLKPGEISKPFASGPNMFRVVELVKRQGEGIKPYSEVASQIEKKLKEERGRKLALKAAGRIRAAMRKGIPLKEAAAKEGVVVLDTPLVSRKDSIPEIPSSSLVISKAFELKEGEHSDIIRTPEGFYIVQLLEKRPSIIPPLSQIKAKVLVDYEEDKAWEWMQKEAPKWAKEVETKGLGKVAKKLGLPPKSIVESDYFTRMGFFPGLSDRVFERKKGEAGWATMGHKLYLFVVVDRKGIDEKDFDLKKTELKNRILSKKREEVFNAWLEDMRKRIEITKNEKFWNSL